MDTQTNTNIIKRGSFKKPAQFVVLKPATQSLDLTDFDRKLLNVLLKASFDGEPMHDMKKHGYVGLFYGMPQAEIAKQMGLPSNFNYWHLRDSMNRFRHLDFKFESPSSSDNELEAAKSKHLLPSGISLLITVLFETLSKPRDQDAASAPHKSKTDPVFIETSRHLNGNASPLMAYWQLHPTAEYHLMDPRRFVLIQLKSMTALSKGPSVALYEICSRFASSPTHSTGFKPFEWWVEALTGHLMSGAQRSTTYSEFKYFSRNALDPAIKEINEKTELSVDVEFKKEGRKIKELRFIVRHKDSAINSSQPTPQELFRGEDSIVTEKELLRLRAVSLRVTENCFDRLCKQYPLDLVTQGIDALEAIIKRNEGDPHAEKIKSENAVVTSIIKEKFQKLHAPAAAPRPSLPPPAPAPMQPRRPIEADADKQDPLAALSADQLDELVKAAIERVEADATEKPVKKMFLARTVKNLREHNFVELAAVEVRKQLDLMGAKQ